MPKDKVSSAWFLLRAVREKPSYLASGDLLAIFGEELKSTFLAHAGSPHRLPDRWTEGQYSEKDHWSCLD